MIHQRDFDIEVVTSLRSRSTRGISIVRAFHLFLLLFGEFSNVRTRTRALTKACFQNLYL